MTSLHTTDGRDYYVDVINTSQTWINVTSDEYQGDEFSLWVKYTIVSIAAVLSLLGGIGNIVTITAYKRSRKLQTSFNHLITNLCILDLFFSLLVLPAIIPLVLTQYQVYSYRTCRMVGYFNHVLSSASVINLVFIAINRYVGIVHSSKYRHLFAAKDMRWWLLSAWISAPIFYLPFIIESAFMWNENNQRCQLNSPVTDMVLKIYKLVMCSILQLFPTIVLIMLYRAIFAKVKECRKMVEHYPRLGSCSPSFVDPELDESRFSRSRFRSIRRHSVSRSRRTDSIVTPKPPGSPLNANSKSNAMAFLQVPAGAASSNAYEEKGEQLNEKQEGIEQLTLHFSSHSLDSQIASMIADDVIRIVQSTPDLLHCNSFEQSLDECVKRNSLKGEDEVIALSTAPLLTSERPRRRMQDLRNLHIMSTIDSESNSKSVSNEHQDITSDHRITPEVSPSIEDFNINTKTCLGQELTPVITTNNNVEKVMSILKDFEKPKFMVGGEAITNTSCYLTTTNLHVKQENFEIASVNKASSLSDISSVDYSAIVPAPQAEDVAYSEEKPQSKCFHRTYSLSCAELPDSRCNGTSLVASDLNEESTRRHSISTCSESKCAYTEKKEKGKFGRRSMKKLNFKRGKYAMSTPEQQKPSITSKIESFAIRRFKSEGSGRYSKSWRKHWRRKTNQPSIKIVIDQATSEDTNMEDSDSINYFAEMEQELQTSLPKLQEVPDSTKYLNVKEGVNNLSPHIKVNGQANFTEIYTKIYDDQNKLSAKHALLQNRLKIMSKSAESLPSQLPSRKSGFTQNEKIGNPIDKEKIEKMDPCSVKRSNLRSSKDTNSTTEKEQSLEVADTRPSSVSDERRSSSASQHVYRYTGAEECCSRNGSVSYISFADDCRRRSNPNPELLRENDDSMKKRKKSRKISVYSHWQRRKSFFSSFHSSASNDSRRHKRRREAEKHIAYSGVAICVAFAISVLPSYAIQFITVLTSLHVPADVQLFVAMLSWLHVVINPTLYGYLNPQYRIVFKQMRRKQKQKCIKCARCCFLGDESKNLSRGPSNASSNRQS